MSAADVQDLLYHESGLKGLSGISNDVRDLEASTDPRAAFALDYFVYRVGLYAGMLAAALGGLDAFVFTAGIGENSVALRARIAEKLAWLGAALDPAANAARRHTDLAAGQPRRPLRHSDRRRTDDRAAHARAADGFRAANESPQTGDQHDDPSCQGDAARRQERPHRRHRQRSIDRLGLRQGISRAGRGTRRHLSQRQGQEIRRTAGA